MTAGRLVLVFLFSFSLFSINAEARRRHHRFKGTIIVNQILNLEGTVTNNGNPVPEFSGVKDGDLLETGDNSSAVVRIPGLGILKLGSKTKLKLAKFSNRSEARFEVLTGNVLMLVKRPGEHEVKLPLQEKISVSSTSAFWLNAEEKQDSVSVYSGKVQLLNLPVSPQPSTSVMTAGVAGEKPQEGRQVSVVAQAAPTNPPPSPTEMSLVASQVRKTVVVTSTGAETREAQSSSDPSEKQISDLESLYALP